MKKIGWLILFVSFILYNDLNAQGKLVGYWPSINPDWMLTPFLPKTLNSNQILVFSASYQDSINSPSNGWIEYIDSFYLHPGFKSCLLSPDQINLYAIHHGSPSVLSRVNYDSIKHFMVTFLNTNDLIDSVLYVNIDTLSYSMDTVDWRSITYFPSDNSVQEFKYEFYNNQWNKIRLATVFYQDNKFHSVISEKFDTLSSTYDTIQCIYWRFDELNRLKEAGGFIGIDTFDRRYFYYGSGLLDSFVIFQPGNIFFDRIKVQYDYNLPFYTKRSFTYNIGSNTPSITLDEIGRLHANYLIDSVFYFYDDFGIDTMYVFIYKFDTHGFMTDIYSRLYDANGNVMPQSDSVIFRYQYLNVSTSNQTLSETRPFNFYPNPCGSVAYLYYESEQEMNEDIVVYSITGSIVFKTKVHSHKGMNLEKLDLSSLHQGEYIVHKNQQVIKFVKN